MIQTYSKKLGGQYYTKANFKDCLDVLTSASCIITFNGKFDLAWMQRELGYKADCVWDVQLGEFILSNQTWRYPSLAKTCENYGVSKKLDFIYENYWSKGIDTTEIPTEELAEYGIQDVISTYECFMKQLDIFMTTEQEKLRLFRLHCNDLLVLQEMEFNGIKYNSVDSLKEAESLKRQITHLEELLCDYTGGVPINFDSGDHLSCLLYGGKVVEEVRVPIGVFKSGAKIGMPRFKVVEQVYELPRLVEPIKGSELKKEGYFSTDKDTLKSLKPKKDAKKIIGWLLERAKLVKLCSTYLEGLPALIKEKGWADDTLYPNYNQCMATTGRLSSTSPNSQNLPKSAKNFCITRF